MFCGMLSGLSLDSFGTLGLSMRLIISFKAFCNFEFRKVSKLLRASVTLRSLIDTHELS